MFRWLGRFRRSGPIYDGRANRVGEDARREIEETLARLGVQRTRLRFGERVQHPTGYYDSQIQATREAGGWRIHDGGVVYGPWLAGAGSKNRPRPGFPGYPHWRLAREEVDAQAQDVAEFVLARYLPRMGGRP